MDKKRIEERFETEIQAVTEYFKGAVRDTRKDFNDELRHINKMRARDKSDMDVRQKQIDKNIEVNAKDIQTQQQYFSTFAQSISLLTENLNMQMEAEYADLMDRKLISLYGMKGGQASKMDTAAPVS